MSSTFHLPRRKIMRSRYLLLLFFCFILFGGLPLLAQNSSAGLQIYAIDVEGGQATLLIAPGGQSILVDTGWPGFENRDADRIAAAMKLAGLQQIDYLLITHYHRDHIGGITQLADKVKIVNFVDHGANMEDADQTREGYKAYEAAIAKEKGKRLTVKPGDKVPVRGLDAQVLTAAREHISSPLSGAGQSNQFCASEPAAP